MRRIIFIVLLLCVSTPLCAQVLTTEKREELRSQIKKEYGELIGKLYPDFRELKVAIKSLGLGEGGDALYVTHPLFNKYEFGASDNAVTIRRWIKEHQEDMKKAKIKMVGLRNRSHGSFFIYAKEEDKWLFFQ
jgi:hypothetical protein